jgi:hypothetical protein
MTVRSTRCARLAAAGGMAVGAPWHPAALAAALALLSGLPAQAFQVGITPGVKSIFLQVGSGTMTGGSFSSGGTPGNNAVINNVSVTVPATSLGAGAQAMTTDSMVANSPWNDRSFCSVPAQIYVGGFYRTPGTGANATLSVTSPASLVSGSDSLSFSTISWVSAGLGDATPTIPSGSFVAGTAQTLLSVTRNTWFESCLQFSYANAAAVPAGTFTGRVTYTLTSP